MGTSPSKLNGHKLPLIIYFLSRVHGHYSLKGTVSLFIHFSFRTILATLAGFPWPSGELNIEYSLSPLISTKTHEPYVIIMPVLESSRRGLESSSDLSWQILLGPNHTPSAKVTRWMADTRIKPTLSGGSCSETLLFGNSLNHDTLYGHKSLGYI